VTGANSLWTNRDLLNVGGSSSFNLLLITNGGRVANGTYAKVGNGNLASNNMAIVTGANSVWTNGSFLSIGHYGGSGNRLVVTNGGLVQNGDGYIGGFSGSSNNIVEVTGAGSRWSSAGIYVGTFDSSNQLVVANGGTVLATNTLVVGYDAASSNNLVTVAGGNLIVTNTAGTGVTDVRRGALTLNSGLLLTDSLTLTNGAPSVLPFNGGTLQTRNTVITNGSALIVGDGTSLATLDLFGNGTHSFNSGLSIANNALLMGNGTVIGNVTNASGGTLSPGASIGQLNVSGNLVLAAGSTNIFELNNTLGTNDNIVGLAAVSYGGNLVVTNLSGTLANGNTFKLFTATTYGGAFSSLVPPTPGAGLRWNTNGLTVNGTLGVVSVSLPNISNIQLLNGTNLVITTTGGTPFDPVYLLTATNVATPMTNWVYAATNYFDLAGNVSITNSITPGEPQRYFRLAVE
jgi:T5SS/PEP-CTERM-associated repeat protein